MAIGDWVIVGGSLNGSQIRRGVTGGATSPNGGGSFVYAFNSIVNTAGAVGVRSALSGFTPEVKGGSVRAAVRRGAGAGPLNFAPMLFVALQADDVASSAYILGLEDDDPHHVVLRKGSIVTGVPAVAIGTNGVLARSADTFMNDTWLHLRLDVILNSNGDVVLRAYRNDLGAHDVASPVWTPIDGVDPFVDDALGINSGSVPLAGGYTGFAFQAKDVGRRGYFDEIELLRQT